MIKVHNKGRELATAVHARAVLRLSQSSRALLEPGLVPVEVDLLILVVPPALLLASLFRISADTTALVPRFAQEMGRIQLKLNGTSPDRLAACSAVVLQADSSSDLSPRNGLGYRSDQILVRPCSSAHALSLRGSRDISSATKRTGARCPAVRRKGTSAEGAIRTHKPRGLSSRGLPVAVTPAYAASGSNGDRPG